LPLVKISFLTNELISSTFTATVACLHLSSTFLAMSFISDAVKRSESLTLSFAFDIAVMILARTNVCSAPISLTNLHIINLFKTYKITSSQI